MGQKILFFFLFLKRERRANRAANKFRDRFFSRRTHGPLFQTVQELVFEVKGGLVHRSLMVPYIWHYWQGPARGLHPQWRLPYPSR